MNPTARQARRMAREGEYLSKGTDPTGSGVLNKREQARADTFYKQPGARVPNNPLIFDSHGDAANALIDKNLYGEWRRLRVGTAPVEVQPTPPAAKLITQPWQQNEALDLQKGLEMMQLQARTGFSPAQQAPNEWVLSNQPIARAGISGYEGNALPPQPLKDFSDLQAPVQSGQLPFATGMGLDPRYAPLTVQGDPAMASFPKMGAEMKSKGKPSSMPPVA